MYEFTYEYQIQDIIAAIFAYGGHKGEDPLLKTMTPDEIIWVLRDIDYWLAVAQEQRDGAKN